MTSASGSRPFVPYRGFGGHVETTMAESTGWWPDRPRRREGLPNGVVVLADDLGFSDNGCFGSEIPTPQDDALHFEQNQFGTPRRFGPVPLPGESTRLEMNVGGEEALAVRGLPRFRGFPPFEGIDVGVCRRSPVSWELYRRRRGFPFTGVLRSVTYRPDPDTAAQLVGRLEQVRRLG